MWTAQRIEIISQCINIKVCLLLSIKSWASHTQNLFGQHHSLHAHTSPGPVCTVQWELTEAQYGYDRVLINTQVFSILCGLDCLCIWPKIKFPFLWNSGKLTGQLVGWLKTLFGKSHTEGLSVSLGPWRSDSASLSAPYSRFA